MATIKKKNICKAISEKLGFNAYDVDQILQVYMQEVIKSLQEGHRIEFRDFGVFELKRRRPRTARNPKTGEKIPVPERTVVNFKPGKTLREKVAGVMPLPKR